MFGRIRRHNKKPVRYSFCSTPISCWPQNDTFWRHSLNKCFAFCFFSYTAYIKTLHGNKDLFYLKERAKATEIFHIFCLHMQKQLKINDGEGKITILLRPIWFFFNSPVLVSGLLSYLKLELQHGRLSSEPFLIRRARLDHFPLGLNKCLMQPTPSTSKYPGIHFQGCHESEGESQQHVKQSCSFCTTWLLARVAVED